MNLAFYAEVRPTIFNGRLSQSQCDGMEAIGEAWGRYGDGSLQKEAYCFATSFHETGGKMVPVYERGAKSYFDKYEPGTAIGKRLGNTVRGDGYRFRGRGFVQLTGRRNYLFVGKEIGIDLLANPDQAMEMATAARILVVGMMRGWFTGKGLNSYIDDVDESDPEDLREFVNARRVVNGTDKADLIGAYALHFELGLKKDRGAVFRPVVPVSPVPAPVAPAKPVPPLQASPAQKRGWFATLLAAWWG